MSVLESAQARAFHCNSSVIDIGMHKIEVINKCGLPALREQRVERRRISTGHASDYSHSSSLPSNTNPNFSYTKFEREIEIQIEEHVYNFGPQRFMKLLTFENGKLTKIQDMRYGQ
jgi:hypothetical protein